MPDISVVTTFHDEGSVAKQSLNALSRCVDMASAAGLTTEVVAVLDRPSAETRRIVKAHDGLRAIQVNNGDLSLSRNDGISEAKGKLVAIVDGDDYCSSSWLSESWRAAEEGTVLRHEWVLSFGDRNEFSQQISQSDDLFCKESLLVFNPFVSSCIAPRELFLRFPYKAKNQRVTGYGFEDWLWLCDTVAAGIRHVVVPGTAVFYRRKAAGMLARESAERMILPPTPLFSPASGQPHKEI